MYFQESKAKKHGKDKKHRHRKDSEGKKVSKLLAFMSTKTPIRVGKHGKVTD